MKHDDFFRRHPVFNSAMLADHLASNGETGARKQEALLSYHKKSGSIVRVRRGLFAVIPPGADTASFPVDPFLVASHLTHDAAVSYHSSLEFHGNAYSAFATITYSASRPITPFTFRANHFRGAKHPDRLVRTGKVHTGVLIEERSGMVLRVTGLERTMVDVLDRPELSGSWEEIWRSLESVQFFNLDMVVEYALMLENATTMARVGFFLEQHRESIMVEEAHLKALRDKRPRQPHYLDRSRRTPGKLISEWNLVVPKEVLDRTWGDVV